MHPIFVLKRNEALFAESKEVNDRCCNIWCCTTRQVVMYSISTTTTRGECRILWLCLSSIAIQHWFYCILPRTSRNRRCLRLYVRCIWLVFWCDYVDQEDVRGLWWYLAVAHDIWLFAEWMSDHTFTTLIDLWLTLTPLRKSRRVRCAVCSGLAL